MSTNPGHGPGVPGAMHLEAFGQAIADAFGECPYHVGSSATSKTWRDVDVRLILDDEKFYALFPGFKAANHIDAWWSLLCAALSELGRARTGLPIDFQIQSMTEANEKYPSGIRNPLFLMRADESRPPVMLSGTEGARCIASGLNASSFTSKEGRSPCPPGYAAPAAAETDESAPPRDWWRTRGSCRYCGCDVHENDPAEQVGTAVAHPACHQRAQEWIA